MPRPKPHPRRDEVLAFLVSYKRHNDGVSPSLTDIAAALRIGKGTIRFHLRQLELAGLITTGWPEARSIKITGGRWSCSPEPPARTSQENLRQDAS